MGFPIFLISKLNTQISRKSSLPPSNNNTPSNSKKRAVFTYYNTMIRNVTNFFKGTNIQSIYRTNNTIRHKIKIRTDSTSTSMCCGIYQLQYNNCNLSYICQNGRCLEPRYKEHVGYITSNNPQSAYAIHILQNK